MITQLKVDFAFLSVQIEKHIQTIIQKVLFDFIQIHTIAKISTRIHLKGNAKLYDGRYSVVFLSFLVIGNILRDKTVYRLYM